MIIKYVEPVPGYHLIYVNAWVYPKAFSAGWGYSFTEELNDFLRESDMILSQNWVDCLSEGFYKLGFASKERCEEFITLLEDYRA